MPILSVPPVPAAAHHRAETEIGRAWSLDGLELGDFVCLDDFAPRRVLFLAKSSHKHTPTHREQGLCALLQANRQATQRIRNQMYIRHQTTATPSIPKPKTRAGNAELLRRI